ncbi:MAG: DNA-packaging protein [Henriciella sp.]
MARYPFLRTARPDQKPPEHTTNWRNWLLLGGRGAGKTRAGAEYIRFAVTTGACAHVALVGPTLGDVREVMIEGPSGLKSIEQVSDWRPYYNVSRRRLEWPFGAVASVFSAEDADSLRGPQFDIAWCDEIAAWPHGEAVWDNLQLGLRLGAWPRCVATTTPRPVSLVERLVAGEAVITRASTVANQAFLAPGFVAAMTRKYGGTALGRQELNGELISDPDGALWTRSVLDRHRVIEPPARFQDLIVAVDPAVTSGAKSDLCGIIVAGVTEAADFGRHAYVLQDASVHRLRPADWGQRVAALVAKTGASQIVAESNQGGEMVEAVLSGAGCDVPITLRHARLGKKARAMPVAALYGRGKVHHVGVLSDLENEMCSFGAAGQRHSPDRVDAVVWAINTLLVESVNRPRIRGF